MNAKWNFMTLTMIGGLFAAMSPAVAQRGTETGPAGQLVAPGNSNPERDSRGTKVISDPAFAPRGANEPLGSQTGASRDPRVVFAAQASTEGYRACTKVVTDRCVQLWEPPRTIPNCPGDPDCPEILNRPKS